MEQLIRLENKRKEEVKGTVGYLLDDLAALEGCECLSDMRLPVYQERLISALQSIDPQSYSLWDWNDAAEYLFHPSSRFQTIDEVYDFMLSACEAAHIENGRKP